MSRGVRCQDEFISRAPLDPRPDVGTDDKRPTPDHPNATTPRDNADGSLTERDNANRTLDARRALNSARTKYPEHWTVRRAPDDASTKHSVLEVGEHERMSSLGETARRK